MCLIATQLSSITILPYSKIYINYLCYLRLLLWQKHKVLEHKIRHVIEKWISNMRHRMRSKGLKCRLIHLWRCDTYFLSCSGIYLGEMSKLQLIKQAFFAIILEYATSFSGLFFSMCTQLDMIIIWDKSDQVDLVVVDMPHALENKGLKVKGKKDLQM